MTKPVISAQTVVKFKVKAMKLGLNFIFTVLCGITLCHTIKQLTLETARGKIKVMNFFHLHKHRLKVEPKASFEVTQDMKCTSSCIRSEGCVSFNVKKLSPTAFLCELLNTSKYAEAKNLTQDDSFSHYYIQVQFTDIF